MFLYYLRGLEWITVECCHHVLKHINCCGTKWGIFFSLSLHTFLHTKLSYQTYIITNIVILIYNRAYEFLPRFCACVQSIDTCVTWLYTVSLVSSCITVILLDQSGVFIKSLSPQGELETVDATELWYEKAKLEEEQREIKEFTHGRIRSVAHEPQDVNWWREEQSRTFKYIFKIINNNESYFG